MTETVSADFALASTTAAPISSTFIVPSFRGAPSMTRHEMMQDSTDQFGHAQPLVERIVPEPEADAARDDHGELHRFRFPGALLFLGEHKCRLPHRCRFLRHAGPSVVHRFCRLAVSAAIVGCAPDRAPAQSIFSVRVAMPSWSMP